MKSAYGKVTGLYFWEVAKEYKENHKCSHPCFYYVAGGEFAPVKSLEQLVKQHKASNLFRLDQWLADLMPKIKYFIQNKDEEITFEPTNGRNLIAFCKMVTEMSEAAE